MRAANANVFLKFPNFLRSSFKSFGTREATRKFSW